VTFRTPGFPKSENEMEQVNISAICRHHGRNLLENAATVIVASILFCIVVLVGLVMIVLLATNVISWLAALIIVGASILVAWLVLWSLRHYLGVLFDRTADQMEDELSI